MVTRLTVLFVIIANYASAQINGLRYPTRFDKFIHLSKVEWAAYANDTIGFDTYNVSNELYTRFQKDEIRISDPLSRDSLMAGNKIVYLNKKDLELKSFAPGYYGNAQRPTNRVDSNSSLLNVKQILYVVNGKLYSYTPWISPLISVYTSRDIFIGTTEYFSSCINTKYNFKPSKRDKLIFIKTTKRKILTDNIPRTDLLKQLYGTNLVEAIWKDLLNEKNEVIDIRNEQKVVLKNVKDFSHTNTVSIPLYDSLGRITDTTRYSEPILPSNFQQIELSQNWFYDRTKNVVVNTITDITLFFRNKGNIDDFIPAFKITFK